MVNLFAQRKTEMNPWLRRLILLGVFTPVHTSAALAQPEFAVPAPAPVPEVIPRQPIIDPAAKSIIEATIARYQAMDSYSDKTSVSGFASTFEAKIIWQKPNKARTEVKSAKGSSFGLNDGTTLWATNLDHPGFYVQRPAEQKRIFDAIHESDATGPGFILTLDKDAMKALLNSGLYKLEMGLPEEIEGQAMQTVRAHFAFNEGNNSLSTYFIGKVDGLLHRVEMSFSNRGSVVENHRQIEVNPTINPETWQWLPPADLKPIEYFSQLNPGIPLLYKAGQKLPTIRSKDISGKPISLENFQGKPTVIYFLAISSGEFDLKDLMATQKRVGAEKFNVVCVSMDGRLERVQEFAAKNDVRFPIIYDGQGWQNEVAVKLGVRQLPTTLLIDKRIGNVKRIRDIVALTASRLTI
jgi:peroxiredoxin/outer membrane lipoprotein-sorting protein